MAAALASISRAGIGIVIGIGIGIGIAEFAIGQPSLDEVFLAPTGHGSDERESA